MYCIGCGAQNIEGSGHCVRCGLDLKTIRTDTYETAAAESLSPKLWNPDMAAFLSWILTPVFGAIIHALNWHSLDQPRKAYISWGWAIFNFLGLTAISIYFQSKFGDGKTSERLLGLASLTTLFVWYFSFGRSQSKFIARQLNGKYTKAGWLNVLCIITIIVSSVLILGSR